MPMKWTLRVKSNFSSAHSLRKYKGKCENLHGHNYAVSIEVEGSTLLPETEIMMDFADLKKILKSAISPLDHKNLNEISPFDSINPSSENIARYLWHKILPEIPDAIRLVSVTVAETNEQSATYMEE